MLLSLSWLSDFVDLGDRSPELIAHDLTMKTALIEGILVRGRFGPGLVVGRVVEKDRHPQADRLSVCRVDVGASVLQVVCGAPNVAMGQTVAVATPGSTLPNGTAIGAAKLRGVESFGMICSEQELGLSEEHGGILVLEDDLTPGTPLSEVRAMADVVFEIDNKSITHRPDLWCHEGFARELAAIYRLPLRRAVIAEDLRAGASRFEIRIDDPDLCGRYAMLSITGDVGRASPAWLQRRLVHCGLRPHSLLVDLSNFMLLDIGQPTHPFDAEKIAGETIVVRRATKRETLITLDDVKRELPEGGIAIADASGAIAIAGVMGGASTSMSAATRHAVLESAWFDPVGVRRTSTAVGLRTDASARFEKNLDPALPERGIRRFTQLLREIAPELVIDATFAIVGDKQPASVKITLRPERLATKLGLEVSNETIRDVLTRLEFEVVEQDSVLEIAVPSFRATRDVLAEDDVIEEVGRLIGYENIATTLPRAATVAVEFEPVNAAWRNASQWLREHADFVEVLSYPYAEDSYLERAGGAESAPYSTIRNPLQQSAQRLRRSLAPSLIEFVDRNIRQVEEVRLFECGKVFQPSVGDRELPYEPQSLAAILAVRSLGKDAAGGLVRRLKGALEDLAPRLERAIGFEPVAASELPAWAHPGRAARVLAGDRRIGVIAELKPGIASGIARKGEIALFEVDLTAWIDTNRHVRVYQPLPRFPAMAVDLSFVAPFSLRYTDVCARLSADAALGASLRAVEFVDEYFAPPIESGKRSLTLRLVFRSDERTLTAQEVAAEVEKARAMLATLGGELRG